MDFSLILNKDESYKVLDIFRSRINKYWEAIRSVELEQQRWTSCFWRCSGKTGQPEPKRDFSLSDSQKPSPNILLFSCVWRGDYFSKCFMTVRQNMLESQCLESSLGLLPWLLICKFSRKELILLRFLCSAHKNALLFLFFKAGFHSVTALADLKLVL